MAKRTINNILYTLLFIICLISMLPIICGLYLSLLPHKYVMSTKLTVSGFTMDHYFNVIRSPDFLSSLKNSFIVSSATTFLSILIGALTAYGLRHMRTVFGNVLALSVLAFRMMPAMALIVPFFLFFRWLHLIDSVYALIIAYLSFSIPFSAWMLRGFFLGIPDEIEEASMLDGCTRIQIIRKILLPMIKPGLIVTTVLVYLLSWSEFMYALVLTNTRALTFLPFSVKSIAIHEVLWGEIFSGSILYIIPVIVVMILLRDQISREFAAGLL